jgi:CheY-like chemotaxis protein
MSLGLPADIAESLGRIVSKWGSIVHIPPLFPTGRTLGLMWEVAPDLVFVWTGTNPGASLLEVVRRAQPQIPVVAVNLRVVNSEILDALDSGAVDYCTPPFDIPHIQWLLHAAHRPPCSC